MLIMNRTLKTIGRIFMVTFIIRAVYRLRKVNRDVIRTSERFLDNEA